jgi:hypothetical protein
LLSRGPAGRDIEGDALSAEHADEKVFE